MHTHTYRILYIYAYIHVYYIYLYAYTHTHIHIYKYVCISTRIYTSTHVLTFKSLTHKFSCMQQKHTHGADIFFIYFQQLFVCFLGIGFFHKGLFSCLIMLQAVIFSVGTTVVLALLAPGILSLIFSCVQVVSKLKSGVYFALACKLLRK